MRNWKFRLEKNHVYVPTDFSKNIDQTLYFKDKKNNVWLEIHPKGVIRIKKNYCWDGCSPKVRISDLMLLGIPDGTPDEKTGLPKTYYASLIHDALYQFLDNPDMPYTRKEADKIFHTILRDACFSFADLYYYAVRYFGGLFHYLNSHSR